MYTVEITNGKGMVVAEAVNADTYTFTVKSTKYGISGTVSFTLTIAPMVVEAVYADVLYTGEELSPIAYFTTEIDGKDVKVDVPADAYKFVISDFIPEKGDKPKVLPTVFKEAGTYKYTMEDAKVGTDNYDVTPIAATTNFIVTAKNVYPDVKAEAWYADEVYAIAKAGIMGGYGNGFFGPNDEAERQDVALMMYRMLTGKQLVGVNAEDWENDAIGFDVVLPFSDANARAYYAEAVWYVNKNGIMTGYGNSDEFGVGDAITREQVAAILFRSQGIGSDTLLASALDAYADADEISGYAVEAMEWAVENGIFGVNTAYLNPGETITRAELAAVFVRFMAL